VQLQSDRHAGVKTYMWEWWCSCSGLCIAWNDYWQYDDGEGGGANYNDSFSLL